MQFLRICNNFLHIRTINILQSCKFKDAFYAPGMTVNLSSHSNAIKMYAFTCVLSIAIHPKPSVKGESLMFIKKIRYPVPMSNISISYIYYIPAHFFLKIHLAGKIKLIFQFTKKKKKIKKNKK